MKKTISIAAALSVMALGFAGATWAQNSTDDANVVYDPALFAGLEYRMIGPTRGGRVTAVAGHADQPSTFYLGATGGGVWKTNDYGQRWWNISDGYFATGSIGAIDVADSDTSIVYVGTGSDGLRSNVIAGRGVYKSTNGGKTWDFVGLREVGQIGAVIIHPRNPDVVLVAAIGHAFAPSPERGVYRTVDGGRTWENVLFVSDSTGAVDLEFVPDNPNEIFASMWRAERKPWTIISGAHEGGVYKSNDGGSNWTKLVNGLPQGLVGKSDLAVSPDDPNRLYVLMEAPVDDGGLYRSDDRGGSFSLVTTYPRLLDRPFYYTNIDADPTNADVLYVNSTRFYKSIDGGREWTRRSTPHGDNHDMWINPNDPNLFIQSNDGGANVTRDGGETWSTQRNQATAELYQVSVDDQFPYWVYAGQQDNSTIMVPSLPPFSHPGGATGYWRAIGGCETGPAVPKPGDANIVYSNCKGRFGRYNKTTGQEKHYYVGAQNMYGHNPRDLIQRFQRVSPIAVSPHDPNIVYHASQFLHVTRDEGVTWEQISPDLTGFEPSLQVISGTPITRDITGEEFYSTIYAVAESPLAQGLIWVGANDGPIHVTRDGGASWTNVTPPDLPPHGRVQTIDPSPHQPNKAYVAVYRYLLGDWEPYIYRTDDYGETWTRLTAGKNGIPADYPTRVVREDPDREGLLYAGTEFGLFVSFDDGAHWQSLQQNLPVTPITDIKVHRQDLVLSTMGRSFWILDDITPLHQLTDQLAAANAHLFAPRPAYRRRDFGSRSDQGPQYPQAGATIDYYLGEAPDGEITLEILDDAGATVRVFSSEAAGEGWQVPDQPSMRDFQLERVGTPRLPSERGMHRFVWDLRHPGVWDAEERRAGRSGPLATSGRYQVRLRVGDWFATEALHVLVDPRIEADGVTSEDLAEQLAISLAIRDVTSEAKLAVHRIQAARQQLKQRMHGAEGATDVTERATDIDKKLADIESRFVNADTRYPQQMLLSQLSYLYGMVNRADQKPGRDAATRLAQLRSEVESHVAELNHVLDSEVTELMNGSAGRSRQP